MAHNITQPAPPMTFEEVSAAVLRRMEAMTLEEWAEEFRILAELERAYIKRDARSDAEALRIRQKSALNGHSANSH